MEDDGVAYKTVNNYRTKGVIITAETLLNLKQYTRSIKDEVARLGATHIVDFLEDCYLKIR